MPQVGFELSISAGERPQIYALERAATGTGLLKFTELLYNGLHSNKRMGCPTSELTYLFMLLFVFIISFLSVNFNFFLLF